MLQGVTGAGQRWWRGRGAQRSSSSRPPAGRRSLEAGSWNGPGGRLLHVTWPSQTILGANNPRAPRQTQPGTGKKRCRSCDLSAASLSPSLSSSPWLTPGQKPWKAPGPPLFVNRKIRDPACDQWPKQRMPPRTRQDVNHRTAVDQIQRHPDELSCPVAALRPLTFRSSRITMHLSSTAAKSPTVPSEPRIFVRLTGSGSRHDKSTLSTRFPGKATGRLTFHG
jgi:hypothetical protein